MGKCQIVVMLGLMCSCREINFGKAVMEKATRYAQEVHGTTLIPEYSLQRRSLIRIKFRR